MMKRKKRPRESQVTKSVKQDESRFAPLVLFLRTLIRFFSGMFPAGRGEWYVFIAAFFGYFLLSLLVWGQTDVIGHNGTAGYWGYLGFDNSWYTNVYLSVDTPEGLFLSRHPFLKLFFVPVAVMGQLVMWCAGLRIRVLFYVICFNVLTALSVLGVWRYLKGILGLSVLSSILPTFIFALFFSNLILCFTPESFPVSQLILITCLIASAQAIKEQREIPFTELFVWTLIGSGITITNGVCVFLLYLLTPANMYRKIRNMLFVSIVMILLYLFYFLFFGGIFLFLPKDQTLGEWLYVNYIVYNRNVAPSHFSLLSLEYVELCLSRFWANSLIGPALFGGVDPTLGQPPGSYAVPQIMAGCSVGRLVPGIILLVMTVAGFVTAIFHRRQAKPQANSPKGYGAIVLLPLLVFVMNIALHLVFLFGYQEPHIYADHWIFVVPMSLGILYYAIQERKIGTTILNVVLSGLALWICLLNIAAFIDFLNISAKAFR